MTALLFSGKFKFLTSQNRDRFASRHGWLEFPFFYGEKSSLTKPIVRGLSYMRHAGTAIRIDVEDHCSLPDNILASKLLWKLRGGHVDR